MLSSRLVALVLLALLGGTASQAQMTVTITTPPPTPQAQLIAQARQALEAGTPLPAVPDDYRQALSLFLEVYDTAVLLGRQAHLRGLLADLTVTQIRTFRCHQRPALALCMPPPRAATTAD